jgi:hypothetical protein
MRDGTETQDANLSDPLRAFSRLLPGPCYRP